LDGARPATDAREDENLLIIARTDARAIDGPEQKFSTD